MVEQEGPAAPATENAASADAANVHPPAQPPVSSVAGSDKAQPSSQTACRTGPLQAVNESHDTMQSIATEDAQTAQQPESGERSLDVGPTIAKEDAKTAPTSGAVKSVEELRNSVSEDAHTVKAPGTVDESREEAQTIAQQDAEVAKISAAVDEPRVDAQTIEQEDAEAANDSGAPDESHAGADATAKVNAEAATASGAVDGAQAQAQTTAQESSDTVNASGAVDEAQAQAQTITQEDAEAAEILGASKEPREAERATTQEDAETAQTLVDIRQREGKAISTPNRQMPDEAEAAGQEGAPNGAIGDHEDGDAPGPSSAPRRAAAPASSESLPAKFKPEGYDSDEAVADMQQRLGKYQARVNELKTLGQFKPDMVAYKQLKDSLALPQRHGHMPGCRVGLQLGGKGEAAILGLHSQIMRGIDANVKVECAYAIALSGSYKDDVDQGATFWYTGEGGQQGGRQAQDQELRAGNLALKQSWERRVPVRVIRAKVQHKTNVGYMYEGLYWVKEFRQVASKDGPRVYQFLMEGIPGESVVSARVEYKEVQPRAVGHKLQLALINQDRPAKKPRTDTPSGSAPRPAKKSRSDASPAAQPGPAKKARAEKARSDSGPSPASRPRSDASPSAAAAAAATISEPPPLRLEGLHGGASGPAGGRSRGTGRCSRGRGREGGRGSRPAAIQVAVEPVVPGRPPYRVLHADISGGREGVKIPLVVDRSCREQDVPPPEFEYTATFTFGSEQARALAEESRQGLIATLAQPPPLCGLAWMGAAEGVYNECGALKETQPTGVMECSVMCQGSGQSAEMCSANSVVTSGIKLPLEVFRTSDCGWGVRCCEDIPVGTYVCPYVGEVVTATQAAPLRRTADPYLFDLDYYMQVWEELRQRQGAADVDEEEQRELQTMCAQLAFVERHCGGAGGPAECLVVNTSAAGNVGRFFRHSEAAANLTVQAVFARDAAGALFYYPAFFAADNVPALSELTYDWSLFRPRTHERNAAAVVAPATPTP